MPLPLAAILHMYVRAYTYIKRPSSSRDVRIEKVESTREEEEEDEAERECWKTERGSKDGRKIDGRWRIDSLHFGSICLAPAGLIRENPLISVPRLFDVDR